MGLLFDSQILGWAVCLTAVYECKDTQKNPIIYVLNDIHLSVDRIFLKSFSKRPDIRVE